MFWNKKEPKKEKVNVKSATFELVATTAQEIDKYTITCEGRVLRVEAQTAYIESPEDVLIGKLASVYCKYLQIGDDEFVNKSTITSFRKTEEQDYFVEVAL